MNRLDDEITRAHALYTALLQVRDALEPIVSGMIERGHCLPGQSVGYGQTPGDRKTTLKDARAIARHARAFINSAANQYIDDSKSSVGEPSE